MPGSGCGDNKEIIFMLSDLYGTNESSEKYQSALNRDHKGLCGSENNTNDNPSGLHPYDLLSLAEDITAMGSFGSYFYAYTTPFIICIGLLGNCASMYVFLSKRLRRLSASLYLAALSASDSVVLITYVFLDWLLKGLPNWPGNYKIALIPINGICHAFLFISYTFRFISVYLIVVFTIERYIAVCKPLHRRMICTKNFARKLIVLVYVMGAAISLFKPVLSGVYDSETITKNARTPFITNHFSELNNSSSNSETGHTVLKNKKMCTRNSDYDDVNFVMELVYGILITAVPFALMTFFNLMIVRKLINRFRENKLQMSFRESKIRWEFTIMLLTVSSCFILLNMPYFVMWVQQFKNTIDSNDPMWMYELSNKLLVTKTIFNINYCINFFVYCLTGSYYRGVIIESCSCSKEGAPNGYISVRKASNSITMTTQGTFV